MFRQIVLSIVVVLATTGVVRAGEIADLAARAESELGAGNGSDAVASLREALLKAWTAAPMTIRKAVFVTDAGGFGVYTPKPDESFAQGEAIVVYMEPIGFTWQPDGELYSSLLIADFEIRSPGGEALAGQKNFGQFEFHSHEQNLEYMATLTLELSGAPAGSYVLVVTLRDRLGGETAEVELPFTIQ